MAGRNLEELWTPEERASKLGSWIINQKNSKEEAMSVYNDGADTFETIVGKLGYEAPLNGTKVLLEFLETLEFDKNCHILDLGAGTGLCGRILFENNFVNITGIDISSKMLEEANNKNVYQKLVECDLNKDSLLEFQGLFDAIICVGLFFPGQVGSEVLEKVPKLLKPGGLFCVTIRVEFYDDEQYGYKVKCENLELKGDWKLIHTRKIVLIEKLDGIGYCLVFQKI